MLKTFKLVLVAFITTQALLNPFFTVVYLLVKYQAPRKRVAEKFAIGWTVGQAASVDPLKYIKARTAHKTFNFNIILIKEKLLIAQSNLQSIYLKILVTSVETKRNNHVKFHGQVKVITNFLLKTLHTRIFMFGFSYFCVYNFNLFSLFQTKSGSVWRLCWNIPQSQSTVMFFQSLHSFVDISYSCWRPQFLSSCTSSWENSLKNVNIIDNFTPHASFTPVN